MKSFVVGVVLVAALLIAVARADPEPEPAKGGRYATSYVSPKFRAAANDDDIELRQLDDNQTDTSSARLFMKKFLLFRNIFGNSNQQPVIPIIITGGASTLPVTGPTMISTGSVPAASGSVTLGPSAPTQLTVRSPVDYDDEEDEEEDDAAAAAADQAGIVDEQAVQAALAAGAQEYIVTDPVIKGTSVSKDAKQPGRVSLRRPGVKRGHVISVRIPPQYRRYFQNGQKVMLNTKNKAGRRRVVKRRGNNNTRRRHVSNKNRRTNAFAN